MLDMVLDLVKDPNFTVFLNISLFLFLVDFLQKLFKYLKGNLQKCLNRCASTTQLGVIAATISSTAIITVISTKLFFVEGFCNQQRENNIKQLVRNQVELTPVTSKIPKENNSCEALGP